MPKVDLLNRIRELQRVRRALLNPDNRTHGQIIDSERRHVEQTNTDVRQHERTSNTERNTFSIVDQSGSTNISTTK